MTRSRRTRDSSNRVGRAVDRTTVGIVTTFGIVGAAVLAAAAIPPSTSADQEAIVPVRSSPRPVREWIGVDGRPLPFDSNGEIEEYLRTAEVVDKESMEIGVTDPVRVRLARDGVQVHGVFRYVDKVYDRARMSDGRLRMNLTDHCHFELAAYELSKLLNMDNVPPTVPRRIDRNDGTLQIWVYDAVMEGDRIEQQMSAPDRLAWMRQVQLMYLFDALIGNDDRTQENILIDRNWKIWLIDHTRAFYQNSDPHGLDEVIYVERGFWEGLKGLTEARLREAIDFMSDRKIEQLLERREHVVAHVEGLIESRGQGAVLFDWAPPQR